VCSTVYILAHYTVYLDYGVGVTSLLITHQPDVL